MMASRLGMLVLWVALAGAAAPAPLVPPPPDLARLIPFAAAPLDKPSVPIPDVGLPPAPLELPPLPPATIRIPPDKPIAAVPPPRTLPCFGAWLGIPAESLECGRARFGRGEYDAAHTALDSAARQAGDPAIAHEARYWLGETLYRLGRFEAADWTFHQVASDTMWRDYRVWALHSSGWTALHVGDPMRAAATFGQLLTGPLPVPLGAWGRHGLGLALYALGRHAEAARAWADMGKAAIPPELARDAAFWGGEAAGRTGDYPRAIAELGRFSRGGDHPLLETGLARLGWWTLAAGRPADAVTPFRSYLARRPLGDSVAARVTERDWVEAGLALALVGSGNAAEARRMLAPLQARKSPLTIPVLLRLIGAALDAGQLRDAQDLVQAALALDLSPRARAWVLLVNGEVYRREGNRDDARTQFDLAGSNDPAADVRVQATLRLARANFEMREFATAASDVTPLLSESLAPEVRLPVLLLKGEGAYRAGDWAQAAEAFRQIVAEFPDVPAARLARLSIAWTALRQGQSAEARAGFLEFARDFPGDPNAPDALVLASELALAEEDFGQALPLLDRVLASHPDHPRAGFARLNRALLMLRAGDLEPARAGLREWLDRAPSPPLVGRAQAALGATLLSAGRPGDARREFAGARREGAVDLSAVGLGAAALAEKKWDEAQREFAAAREAGTAPVVQAAEYGLAVVAFERGAIREFKAPALAALAAEPRGPSAPGLLYVLTGIAVEEKDWKTALATVRRLVTDFPASGVGDSALERIGSAASSAAAWPTAYEAYTLLRERYPRSPFVDLSVLTLAEAQIQTGHARDARQALERFVAASPGDPRVSRALVLLARTREATGDAPGALEAYSRASAEGRAVDWSVDALASHARLLTQAQRWAEARTVLDRLVRSQDAAVAARGARAIGETYEAEGDRPAAIEWNMTAAYAAPESEEGRRALLAAARSYAALNQADAAAIVYRKLLAQPNLPADLAEAARQGLVAIKR